MHTYKAAARFKPTPRTMCPAALASCPKQLQLSALAASAA